MIRLIIGTVEYMDDGGVVVIVQGIGYLVCVPARLLEKLRTGAETRLYTYHHIREDQQALYGFEDRSDLGFFRQLISVSGVGPKMALQVLSRFSAEEVKRAIVHGDMAVLTSISGVGRKTAERIIVDLKETVSMTGVELTAGVPANQTMHVLEALLALGYSKDEALPVIREIDQSLSLEEQVRSALRLLSQSRS